MTKHELKYIHLLMKLHRLIAEDKGDSDEADSIRDQMDMPWIESSAHSNRQFGEISAWCYGLTLVHGNRKNVDGLDDRGYLFKEFDYDIGE